MRIFFGHLKKGILKLRPEVPEDILAIEQVLEPGDFVTARTRRSGVLWREEQKIKKEKRMMRLKIRVAKIMWQAQTGRLRISGEIVSGPRDIELGAWHTINCELGMDVTIQKERWKKWQISRLKRRIKRSPTVLICALDYEKAAFALIGEGIDFLGQIPGPGTGKRFPVSRGEYFGQLISWLKTKTPARADAIIIAGPGFVKNDLLDILKERAPDLAKKAVMESASYAGKAGIREVISRGGINRVIKGIRIGEETAIIEQLLQELAKDGRVVYGKEDVIKSVEMGAVAKLLILETALREFYDMLEMVEKFRGDIMIISAGHEAANKLKGLGGIAAFLRFKI